MTKIGMVSLLALSLTVTPVLPAFAVQNTQSATEQTNLRKGVAVLTQEYLDAIKLKAPALYQKILAAQQSGQPFVATDAEARYLQSFNIKTMNDVKAGAVQWVTLVPAVVAVVAFIYQVSAKNTGTTPPAGLAQFLDALICLLSLGALTEACTAAQAPAPATPGKSASASTRQFAVRSNSPRASVVASAANPR